MSKAPAMPMYWDAYLADTTHLTTEEHGAYMLLIAAMWRRNGCVPDDDKDNARILGLTKAKWLKIKARLTSTISGFCANGDTITQEKLLKTWKITQEKIEKNAANGAKGGRPKASNSNDLGKANGCISVKPNESIPEPEPEPKKRDTSVSPKKRACALPPDWVPSDKNIDHALSKQMTQQEIDHEADRFRDYHLAKGTTFKDWDAGWRTWVGNAIKYRNGRMVGGQGSAGRGSGGGLAGAVARRRLGGEI